MTVEVREDWAYDEIYLRLNRRDKAVILDERELLIEVRRQLAEKIAKKLMAKIEPQLENIFRQDDLT